jgi:DNA polymerase III sliding clamp (beta) subunit (PCNA family)
MKCKLTAGEFRNLVKSLQALRSLGLKGKDEDICCVLTIRNDRLYVEGANLGVYLRRNVPVTVMTEGSCGIKLSSLSKLKFTSDVTLAYDADQHQLRATSKQSRFELQTDQTAVSVIEASRLKPDRAPIKATVPLTILQEATATITIKPSLGEDSLCVLFSLLSTPEGGKLEIVGTEHYSMARYWQVDPEIKVLAPLQFALSSNSCSLLMKEVTSPQVGIGVELGTGVDGGKIISLVRFSSPDTEVYYPTIEVEFQDAEANGQEIREGRSDGSFVATRAALREAIGTVKVVHDSATAGLIHIRISHDRVEFLVKSATGAHGNTIVPTTSITLPNPNKPQVIQLKEQYLAEAVDLAPDGVPLRIESWDKKLLFVEATKIEHGGIEFLVSQVLAPEAPAS